MRKTEKSKLSDESKKIVKIFHLEKNNYIERVITLIGVSETIERCKNDGIRKK